MGIEKIKGIKICTQMHLTENGIGQLCRGGYSLIQLLVVMLLVSILATAAFTAYRESVRAANLRAAHAALLENARFMEQFYTKKGSFKLTSTKWPELPVKEAGGFVSG